MTATVAVTVALVIHQPPPVVVIVAVVVVVVVVIIIIVIVRAFVEGQGNVNQTFNVMRIWGDSSPVLAPGYSSPFLLVIRRGSTRSKKRVLWQQPKSDWAWEVNGNNHWDCC